MRETGEALESLLDHAADDGAEEDEEDQAKGTHLYI